MSIRNKITLAMSPLKVGRETWAGQISTGNKDRRQWPNDSQKSTVPGNDEQLIGNNCTDRKGWPAATRSRAAFAFIRLEVVLKIADSAFE